MTRRRARSIPGAAVLRHRRPRRPPPGGPPPRPRPARRPGRPPPHHAPAAPRGPRPLPRLTALDRIAAAERRPWQRDALLEDYELGLHMRLAGYGVTHVADTGVTQEALPYTSRFLTQRTRWAQGDIRLGARLRPAAARPDGLGEDPAERRDGGRRPGRDGGLRRTGRGPEPCTGSGPLLVPY
ncbi:glycosyltransferase [Streptomyces tanashiensis]|uniref:glycosyltransferase n=1 Tax=Streptomyces tanashiensis TaxID=67367 RepID=UPI003F4D37A7